VGRNREKSMKSRVISLTHFLLTLFTLSFVFRHRPSIRAAAMKYVLVTGGVVSGLGKGVTASSIGLLLQKCGYRVTAVKIGESEKSWRVDGDRHTPSSLPPLTSHLPHPQTRT